MDGARQASRAAPTMAARREAAWARRRALEDGGRRPAGRLDRLLAPFRPDTSPFIGRALSGLFFAVGLRRRGRRNALDIEVRERTIHLPRLPAVFDGFRILQIGDLHLDALPAFPAHLADRVTDLAYDLCVVTGDLRYRQHGDLTPALDGFRHVRERLHDPVYAVLGNHDAAAMRDPLEAMGVRVLVNEATILEKDGACVHLIGVDDPHGYRTDDLEAALDGVPASECRILLAHAPEIYREAEARGIDLLLCGHTHGGQIALPGGWPPFLNVRCPRRFASRAWSFGSLRGYTTVGAGCSSLPLRFHVRPEVVIHRLGVAD